MSSPHRMLSPQSRISLGNISNTVHSNDVTLSIAEKIMSPVIMKGGVETKTSPMKKKGKKTSSKSSKKYNIFNEKEPKATSIAPIDLTTAELRKQEVARIREERRKEREEKLKAHEARKVQERKLLDEKLAKADQERRGVLEFKKKMKMQELKQKQEYINEKRDTELLHKMKLSVEATKHNEEKAKFEEEEFHLRQMFAEKQKKEEQQMIKESVMKAREDFIDVGKVKEEWKENDTRDILNRLEEANRQKILQEKQKEKSLLAMQEANEKARQDAEDVKKLEAEKRRRKRESMAGRLDVSARHAEMEAEKKAAKKIAMQEANEKARQDAEDVKKLEAEKRRRKRESMAGRYEDSLRLEQFRREQEQKRKIEFLDLVDEHIATFHAQRKYISYLAQLQASELKEKWKEYERTDAYLTQQAILSKSDQLDLSQDRQFFYEAIRNMKQSTKESMFAEIEYKLVLAEKEEAFKLLQEYDRQEIEKCHTIESKLDAADAHDRRRNEEQEIKNELQAREGDNRRYQLHNLMLQTEQKLEEAELRKAHALDRSALAHKFALDAYNKQQELRQVLDARSKSIEYDEARAKKEAMAYKDMIEYAQEDRLALKEAKLSLAMSERASLIDAYENALRTELYEEELKEAKQQAKEEDNHWYLLNKEAILEYKEKEKQLELQSLELDRDIAENGRVVEELNCLELKQEENQLRECAKIDREAIQLKKEMETILEN